jgi:L-galactose dehydrogenase/L-glyceraldehyde 3-phosphate reductase
VEYRVLGRTELRVSRLGFGCGNLGGLMVRGTPADQERAVARALELGITYFDTAPMYGNGESETNLGRVLATLRPDIVLATKAPADPERRGHLREAIVESAEASLRRLRRERVDVFQLHTAVTLAGGNNTLDVRAVTEEVIPAFEALRQAGKIGFYGFSGTGDAAALPQLIATGAFDLFQCIYNILNPSAGAAPFAHVGADYANVLARATEQGMGAVGIRVLAGGALSSIAERHPISSQRVVPMGTSADYAGDVAQARRLQPLVTEGLVGSLPEAALRFAISHPAISSALVGFSDNAQIEAAATAEKNGPLPPATLQRIADLLPA